MALENWLKILPLVGAILSFFWGVHQWRAKADSELKQRQSESERLQESRRIEATKPFLEKQLALYTEATKVAAKIATLPDGDEVRKATARFWELYWGELAIVENKAVEGAMKNMGDLLRGKAAKEELARASLKLAHAVRNSLDSSWGIQAWSSPDEAAMRTTKGK